MELWKNILSYEEKNTGLRGEAAAGNVGRVSRKHRDLSHTYTRISMNFRPGKT